MKITLVHQALIPPALYGGTERVIAWLALALKELGHSVSLISLPGSKLPGINVIPLASNQFHRWPDTIPKDTDIVHLRGKPPHDLPYPVIVTMDGNGQPDETFHRNTVFLSRRHAENHSAEVFVHHGLPFHTSTLLAEPRDYVVFLAKASWSVKNLKGAIDVARSINVPIKILGSRNYPLNAQQLTASLGLPVQYYGMVSDSEKFEILKYARALFFPVRWDEPFGLAVIEAMSVGVPVLATPYGSLPDIINKENGFLSASSLEWGRFYQERISTGFDRFRCREQLIGKFDSTTMAKRYLDLYQEIISGKSLHPHPPKTRDGFFPKKLLPWN